LQIAVLINVIRSGRIEDVTTTANATGGNELPSENAVHGDLEMGMHKQADANRDIVDVI
jgi:hypothetical protein